MHIYIYIYLFICAFKNHLFIHLFIYLFFNIRTYIHMIRHMIDYCVQVCIYICVLERERGGKNKKRKQARKERKKGKERKEGKNDILLSCWLAALRALDSLYSWISQFLYHRQRLFSSRPSDRLRSIQSTCTVKPNCFSVQSWARGVHLDIYSYS